jgi:hypothetical protein
MARAYEPWVGGLIALLPVAAASAMQPAPAAGAFVAPPGPLVLTRTLRRPLPDGAEIVSTRRYEVRIVAEGGGYRVDGHLIDAEVTAPESLEALAALERNRPDTGLFPFRLDRMGKIASPAVPSDRTADGAAAASARLAIAGSSLAAPDRAEAQGLIDRLTALRSASGARWPADLFNPAPGLRSQTSRFALPNGKEGSVTTTIDARRGADGDSIERTVITETGGTQRITRETYRVEPQRG